MQRETGQDGDEAEAGHPHGEVVGREGVAGAVVDDEHSREGDEVGEGHLDGIVEIQRKKSVLLLLLMLLLLVVVVVPGLFLAGTTSPFVHEVPVLAEMACGRRRRPLFRESAAQTLRIPE